MFTNKKGCIIYEKTIKNRAPTYIKHEVGAVYSEFSNGEKNRKNRSENVPCSPIFKKYTDGSCMKQFLFLFGSREFYGADVNQCIENLSFYERFSDWISEQNNSENFPVLSGKRTVISIEILTGGYQFIADTNTARYQIQLRLIYEED